MLARAPLPKCVNTVGDRIGLNYGIDRKLATRKFVEESQESTKLEFDQLKNTYYSLTELRTKKQSDSLNNKIKNLTKGAKNPLKLNSRLRKSLYKLSNEEKKKLEYSTFERVHQLWLQYVGKVLCDNDPMGVFRMDLHGCLLRCTASKNPTLVGAEGIVVQETKNTFLIIKTTNRLLILPKRESIFEFNVGENIYKIHGFNLLFTTQTRTKKSISKRKVSLTRSPN